MQSFSSAVNGPANSDAETAIFSAIEDELHDAKRVKSHGQEEDLRMALDMVIRRVGELMTLLRTAYSRTNELEIQLGVAQSNLQIVMANNEMLEEALKRDKNVGWRRSMPPGYGQRTSSIAESADEDCRSSPPTPTSASASASASSSNSPTIPEIPVVAAGSRFFNKFRLSRPTTPRPSTPPAGSLSSASMPSLLGTDSPNPSPNPPAEEIQSLQSQIATLQSQITSFESQISELQSSKEQAVKAKEDSIKEKKSLEEELENLSQALFEEANKMVSTERIKHHETESSLRDEVDEIKEEKEALKRALRVVERENQLLREKVGSEGEPSPSSRSSSRIGVKSPVGRSRSSSVSSSRAGLPPLSPMPPTLSLEDLDDDDDEDDEDGSGGQKTARPPPSPHRQSRAFGPPETLPISSLEVLRLLKEQGEIEQRKGKESEQSTTVVEDSEERAAAYPLPPSPPIPPQEVDTDFPRPTAAESHSTPWEGNPWASPTRWRS